MLLFGLFCLPARWTVLVFAIVFTLAAWEWAGFGGCARRRARLAYTVALAALLGLGWRWSGSPRIWRCCCAAACVWWVIAFLWLCLAPTGRRRGLALLCGVPVLVPSFIALARVLIASRGFARGPGNGACGCCCWCSRPTSARFSPDAVWGRRKLAPRVSPGKTWEGAGGGLAAVALVALRRHVALRAAGRGRSRLWLRGRDLLGDR